MAQHLAFEVGYGSEDAAIDDVSLEFGEPALDLEPGRIGGSEVQTHVGMLSEKASRQIVLMRSEVIQNEMHRPPRGLRGGDLFPKTDKLLAGVACGGLAEHFASLRIQNRIQRERPVPVILETVLLSAPRG